MAVPKKPLQDVEGFIKSAKAEEHKEDRKDKKFLLDLPYDLWYKLKLRALQEGKPLKELMVEALRRYVE